MLGAGFEPAHPCGRRHLKAVSLPVPPPELGNYLTLYQQIKNLTKTIPPLTLLPMLAIRLQRIGKKHQPYFRIVVAERRSKLGGPPVEDLGSYNPSTKAVSAQKEKVAYWIKSGAKATPTVWNLLVKAGVVSGPKIAIKMAKPKKAEAVQAAAVPAPEASPATAENEPKNEAPVAN